MKSDPRRCQHVTKTPVYATHIGGVAIDPSEYATLVRFSGMTRFAVAISPTLVRNSVRNTKWKESWRRHDRPALSLLWRRNAHRQHSTLPESGMATP